MKTKKTHNLRNKISAPVLVASTVFATAASLASCSTTGGNDSDKEISEPTPSAAVDFAQIPMYYFDLSGSLNKDFLLCKDENGTDININLNFSRLGFTYFWNDSSLFNMMVPNGTFKSLSECVDNQWIRSDEQYFALMSDNKARVSNNFFGDVKFGNKDPVLTSAMTPTKLDDFDALKIAMVDTTDVFGEASDFYLTFETPDGQPYKVADNIMIAKPTNYDSLHPSWNLRFNAPFVMKLRIYSNNSPGNYYGYSDYGMAYVNDYYCGQTLSNLKVAGDDFAIDAGLPDGLGLGDSDNEVSGNLHSYAVLHANNYGSLNPGTNHYGLSRLLPWKNDGSILPTPIQISDPNFVASATLNISSISDTFWSMPQEQLFEMDVGQPFFDAPSRQLVTGVNTFSTDSEDGNWFFSVGSTWTMDFSTTKIYDISGKQLTGSNFPLYFEKMDVSMSYSTDNSLGIAGISMWDPVTPLINAYGVNSGSGWNIISRDNILPFWEEKDYITVDHSQLDKTVLTNVGWENNAYSETSADGTVSAWFCGSLRAIMTFSQNGINFASDSFLMINADINRETKQ